MAADIMTMLNRPLQKDHGIGSRHGQRHHAVATANPAKQRVTRTLAVVMNDNYYEPENLVVNEGETIRFGLSTTVNRCMNSILAPQCIKGIRRK